MKNERIVRAYDSIKLTPQQKERMLRSILAEADLEKPVRKERKKEPVVYTARASKTNPVSLIATVAACVAVVAGSVFLLSKTGGMKPSEPVYASPSQTEEVTLPFNNPFDAVLEKYYRAIEEGWTREQCEIEGISPRMEAGADLTKVGYALLDLDGDGREELLIAEETVPHMDNIWDIYTTLEDGTPIQLWCYTFDGEQCGLYETNVLQIGITTKDESEYTFYQLQGRQLVLLESLQYEDEDTVFHTDAEGNTRTVDPKEAQDIAYSRDNQKLELTWLTDCTAVPADNDEREHYTQVLEKYRTALREKWDMQMCSDNDISLMISWFTEEPDKISVHLLDLDGDSVMELIITDGMMIYDLYTLKDSVPVHLITGWERNSYQLCLDNVIYNRGSNGAASSVNNYYRLRDGELIMVESVVFDANKDFDNPWFRSSDGETPEVPLTETEAYAILDSYPNISILGISLLEME